MGKSASKLRQSRSTSAVDDNRINDNRGALSESNANNKTKLDKLGASGLDMAELPDDATIELEFDRFISDLGLSADKTAGMKALPKERKWILILQHQQKANPGSTLALRAASNNELGSSSSSTLKSPKVYIDLLRKKTDMKQRAKDLLSLEVALRTLAVSWVGEFVLQNEGLNILIDLLLTISLKPILTSEERDVQHQLIRCFRTIMNNSIGLKAVMDNTAGISTFALGLDCEHLGIKAKVLELLGAICLVPPTGLVSVLEALTNFKFVKCENFRFQGILLDFQKGDPDYQLACLVFINAITNASDEAFQRVNLRLEFIHLGLLDMFEKFSQSKYPDIVKQVNVFEEQARADFEEISLSELDAKDIVKVKEPGDILNAIKSNLGDAGSHNWLIRSLQQMLILSTANKSLSGHYWRLLYSLTNELNAQRFNVRLDYQKINVNLAAVAQVFANEEIKSNDKVHDTLTILDSSSTTNTSNDLNKQIVDLNDKLNLARQKVSKGDAEVKILIQRLDAQGQELQDLKKEKLELEAKLATALTTTTTAPVDASDAAPSQPVQETEEKVLRNLETKVELATPPVAPPFPSIAAPLAPPPPPPAPLPPGLTAFGTHVAAQAGHGVPPPPIAPMISSNKKVSNVKMKQLQWSKLPPATIEKTIWSKIGRDEKIQNKINYKEIEDLFAAVSEKAPKPTTSNPDLTRERAKEITLLDTKKAYNIAIMLSRVKISFAELRKAVLRMDDDILGDQLLRQLMLYIPNQEEQMLLQENVDQYDQFGKAEQFYLEMTKINRYEQRLKSIQLCRHFKEKLTDLRPNLEIILNASQELNSAKNLFEVLEIILHIGNYMNGNSFRGNVQGFQLDILTKLVDIRCGRGSFVNYLEELISKNFKHLQKFNAELTNIEKASKLSYATLLDEFAELQKGITFLMEERSIQSQEKKQDQDDLFGTKVKTFLQVIQPEFEKVSQLKASMEAQYQKALSIFGEDSKTQPEVFFGIFTTFNQVFERARIENAKAQAKAATETKNTSASQSNNSIKVEGSNEARRGVMDELICALKTGDAIAKRNELRRMGKEATASNGVHPSKILKQS